MLNVIKINGKTNRHCIYGNYNITLCKPWFPLMDFMHLYGRKPWHPENRDQVEMRRVIMHLDSQPSPLLTPVPSSGL